VNVRRQEVNRYDNRSRGQAGFTPAARRITPDSKHSGSSRAFAGLPAAPGGATGPAKNHRSHGEGQVTGGTVPANGELSAFRPPAEDRIVTRARIQSWIPSCQRDRHLMRCDEHAP